MAQTVSTFRGGRRKSNLGKRKSGHRSIRRKSIRRKSIRRKNVRRKSIRRKNVRRKSIRRSRRQSGGGNTQAELDADYNEWDKAQKEKEKQFNEEKNTIISTVDRENINNIIADGKKRRKEEAEKNASECMNNNIGCDAYYATQKKEEEEKEKEKKKTNVRWSPLELRVVPVTTP